MWSIGKLASSPFWLKRQYSHRFAARRFTWRPSVNRTARSGDPRRTSPERRAPAKNHLAEMDHPRLLCTTEQVARSALPSRFRASGSKGERWKWLCSVRTEPIVRVFIIVKIELMTNKCRGPTEALTPEKTSESLLERNRSAVGKSQSPAELASALLCSCFASQVACPNRPSCPRDQSTY